MTIVKNAVETYIKANLKDLGPHDRTTTIGSSEIGQCERKVWFSKAELTELGSTFERNPDYVDSWGARERGNLVENHLFVPAIRKQYGRKAKLLGRLQLTFVDGVISATPDCLILADPQFMIECKSIDPRAELDEPKPEHVYQVQIQMGILHAKTKWRPAYAILVYFNASFLNEIAEFHIDYDPDVYQRAQVRALKIMTAGSHHELQPEGWIAGGDDSKECAYCPFTNACGRARKEVPSAIIAPADKQFIAEISDIARQYKTLAGTIKAFEEDHRRMQNEIKERLREKGQSKIVGDGVTVSWSAVKGRESFDMNAITEAYTKLVNAVHDAFMALCAYRDNPDNEVFQDAIDTLGTAPSESIDSFKREGTPGDRLTVTIKPATMADKAKVALTP